MNEFQLEGHGLADWSVPACFCHHYIASLWFQDDNCVNKATFLFWPTSQMPLINLLLVVMNVVLLVQVTSFFLFHRHFVAITNHYLFPDKKKPTGTPCSTMSCDLKMSQNEHRLHTPGSCQRSLRRCVTEAGSALFQSERRLVPECNAPLHLFSQRMQRACQRGALCRRRQVNLMHF